MINVNELTVAQVKEISSMLVAPTAVAEKKEQHRLLGKKVLIRTYSAGVHYGTLAEKKGTEVVLEQVIRIWGWEGAASLSQLALDGTNKPDECNFSVPAPSMDLQWIEIIECSDKACKSIEGVKTWKV